MCEGGQVAQASVSVWTGQAGIRGGRAKGAPVGTTSPAHRGVQTKTLRPAASARVELGRPARALQPCPTPLPLRTRTPFRSPPSTLFFNSRACRRSFSVSPAVATI